MKLFPYFVLSFLVIAIDVMPLASGADILVSEFLPIPSSHPKSMSAITHVTGALTRRGHNVTILTSSSVGTRGFQPDTYNRAIHYEFVDIIKVEADQKEIIRLSFENSQIEFLKAFGKVCSTLALSCKNFFADTATVTLLKESTFDLLIGDVFDACDSMLASYLGIPYIAVTTAARYPFFNERTFGIPAPSSYVPLGIFPLTDKMNFSERITSFLEHHVVFALLEWFTFSSLDKIKDSHGIAPGQTVKDLAGGAELWLCMTNFALDYPHPTAPNWVAIGNIADIPAKPLPKEYESFIEGSGEHGFVILSMGTYYSKFPKQEMAEAFARVFSELPQRVVWRYTGTRPRYLGNNTMLVDWLPQNDLIGHPKARLLVYHGGLTGILEAVYHAVPMVVMPMFAEQESNALRVETKGMGRRLNKNSISYETVRATVTEVLDNPSYTENARRISSIYRDTKSNPDETVVFWVEHILKFGGSHLRSRALELSFIQLHSIDVLAFIVGIVLVTVFLLYSCCKRCLSCCFKSKKAKVE